MSDGRKHDGFLPGRHLIDAYGGGGFRFADMSHRGSLLALPSGMRAWSVRLPGELTIDAFRDVLTEAEQIDSLLVGTGSGPFFLAASVGLALKSARMSVDVMSTGSAARIYNIMVGENRRVAAALLAVD
jgi:uncharacterized protein